MSYLDPTTRGLIQARIARKQTQLSHAYDALDAALNPERAPVQSYRFNSGEGDQYASHRDPQQIQNIINQLEQQVQRDTDRLSGTGIVNMNLRRRR